MRSVPSTTIDAMPSVSLAPLFSEEVRRDPFPHYARLHEAGALCRVDDSTAYDFVAVSHDAVTQVLRDQAFEVVDETRMIQRPSWTLNRTRAVFANSIMFTNSPRHQRMRRLFQHTFSPRRLDDLTGTITDVTRGLLDRMAQAPADRPLDFMAAFAYPMPAAVLGRVLGVPDEDLDWYRPRAGALAKVIELGGSTDENIRRSDQAATELCDYFSGLVEKRRVEPRDDLITELVQAQRDDPDLLTDPELLSNLIVVFNAGFVTTVHLLGNGLTLMLDQPDTFDLLRREPKRAGDYVDEILRCEGPTHFVVRVASRDTEILGTAIPAGATALVLLAAANRDPRRFPDPDRFDPTRRERSHLAFSAGPHYCLGAALARIEGARGLAMLLERFPHIAVAAEPATRIQLMLRGHEELLVRLGADGV